MSNARRGLIAFTIVACATSAAPAQHSKPAPDQIAGQVIVAGPLYSSADLARKAMPVPDAKPIAVEVLEDQGDVVKVATKQLSDCVDSIASFFELTTWVPRAAVFQRLTKEVVAKHADGTGYVLGIGTPVTSTDAGVVPVESYLRGVPAIPKSVTLGYAIQQVTERGSLADLGDPLVCDPNIMERKAWEKRLEAQHVREHKPMSMLMSVPQCGLVFDDVKEKPKLNGKPYAIGGIHSLDQKGVVKKGKKYLADLGTNCAMIRIDAPKAAVTHVSALDRFIGDLGTFSTHDRSWQPKPGPAYWPDGSLAGTYTGKDGRYYKVEVKGDLICVDVDGLATKVCHKKTDVTVKN